MSDTTTSAPEAPFPPATIEAFLRFCAGEWMSLRSQFALGAGAEEPAQGETGDEWHSSERGELIVEFLEPSTTAEPGGLRVATKAAPLPATTLTFSADGRFHSVQADHSTGGSEGHWTLWPDGSLELVVSGGGAELRDKLWFTKPNLRLRSTVETRLDGSPGRASFSSEIRRVSRPTPPST